jgi:hypothetical protein
MCVFACLSVCISSTEKQCQPRIIGGQASGSNKLMTVRKFGYSTLHYIYNLRRKTPLDTHVRFYATSTFPAVLRRAFTICFNFHKMVFRNFIFVSSNNIYVLHTPRTKI